MHVRLEREAIRRSVCGERMFTTQIIRTVLRVARVRYFLFGAVGAGAVGAKLVSFFTTVFTRI